MYQYYTINGRSIQLAMNRNTRWNHYTWGTIFIQYKPGGASVSMLTIASSLTLCVLSIKQIVLYIVLTLIDCANR